MVYFTFNDIRSDSMKNIIVESLPPIVKPPKRYNLVNINGSDRTNIETLGYEAYVKPITIWFKDDNIDPIVNWLDGSGKLILSNELDKYYDAEILEQIDYEKAIRYRKARIPFLVQPFKHATKENEVTLLTVFNRGNIESLPLMTVYGSGVANISINGAWVCTLTINDFIILDSQEQEAYKGEVLQNRSMVGTFPKLKPGFNTISYTGNVTSIKTLVRSRWK